MVRLYRDRVRIFEIGSAVKLWFFSFLEERFCLYFRPVIWVASRWVRLNTSRAEGRCSTSWATISW
jgi:hypothetical protein